MFRVYYDNDKTWDGSPESAPTTGVIAIVQPDPDHGRHVLSRWDYYCWHGEQWWGHDLFGLFDCLTGPGWKRVLFGRTIETARFRDIVARAEADPDFPRRSARHPQEAVI